MKKLPSLKELIESENIEELGWQDVKRWGKGAALGAAVAGGVAGASMPSSAAAKTPVAQSQMQQSQDRFYGPLDQIIPQINASGDKVTKWHRLGNITAYESQKYNIIPTDYNKPTGQWVAVPKKSFNQLQPQYAEDAGPMAEPRIRYKLIHQILLDGGSYDDVSKFDIQPYKSGHGKNWSYYAIKK